MWVGRGGKLGRFESYLEESLGTRDDQRLMCLGSFYSEETDLAYDQVSICAVYVREDEVRSESGTLRERTVGKMET